MMREKKPRSESASRMKALSLLRVRTLAKEMEKRADSDEDLGRLLDLISRTAEMGLATRFELETAVLIGLPWSLKKPYFEKLEAETLNSPNDESLSVEELMNLKNQFFPENQTLSST